MQTKPYSLVQYRDAGCFTLTRGDRLDAIGVGLHQATGGMVCNGCFMQTTSCPALKKLSNTIVSEPKGVYTETVRQEAARRGISISEVRRQRR